VTNRSRRNLKNKDHKVILIGDSHARELADKISKYLGNSYEITGYVNPGTGLEVITNSAKNEIDNLTQKDVVIVCGGANNVSKNESVKGLKCVTQFVQHRRNTNVIIMKAPHRFDLEESSCVNKEIKVFNRKLKQIMKRYNHTEVIDMRVNRDQYTKHGLHMNKRGKEHIARKTADTIDKLFANQKLAPITLEWKESLVRRNQPETIGHKESDIRIEQQELRTSSRTRKQPGKMDSFLWSTR
jgi:lysophospholipase L1-like esterase